MSEKTKCTIYLAINESGEYECANDEGTAAERLDSDYGGDMRRIVKLTLSLTRPHMTETEMDIADDVGTTEKIEPEAA